MNRYEVLVERISPEGKGMGVVLGRPVYIAGVLPGEKLLIELTHKKHYTEGEIVEWIEKSPQRVKPQETHFLSCSPLQIAEYTLQVEIKEQMLQNLFQDRAREDISVQKFHSAKETFGYRTKIEFSFVEENGALSLAFHEREEQNKFLKLENGCKLASKAMNKAALKIVDVLNGKKVNLSSLKTLSIRESKTTNDIIAILYVSDNNFDRTISLADFNSLLQGLVVIYSNPETTLRLLSHVILKEGNTELVEEIFDKKITYAYDSFFQNNLEMVAHAIEEIRNFVPAGAQVIELYAGVGAVGINTADKAKRIFAYESFKPAVESAIKNTRINKIKNYHVERSRAERVSRKKLGEADIVLMDPPRAGLSKPLIENIRNAKPGRLIYLSCNPATLVNNYNGLKDLYKPVSLQAFDFYPQTEHIECLLVLDLF